MDNKKPQTKKHIIIGIILLYLLLPFWGSTIVGVVSIFEGDQWLYFHGDGFSGRVIDVDTEKPIADAIVIARWALQRMWHENPFMVLSPLCFMLNLHYSDISNEVILVTNKDGYYEVPSWSRLMPWKYGSYAFDTGPHIDIYRPGYSLFETSQNEYKLYNAGKYVKESLRHEYYRTLETTKLKMSMDDKDIEKSYQHFFHGFYTYSREFEWVALADLIEKSLVYLPEGSRRKIQKDINDKRKFHEIGGK